jgi:hypothetical protein
MGATYAEGDEVPPLVQIGAIHFVSGRAQLRCTGQQCTLLQGNECSEYRLRPRGCREYPFYNLSGELYYDSGCPGFSVGIGILPKAQDLRPVELYVTDVPLLLRRMLLWIFKRW